MKPRKPLGVGGQASLTMEKNGYPIWGFEGSARGVPLQRSAISLLAGKTPCEMTAAFKPTETQSHYRHNKKNACMVTRSQCSSRKGQTQDRHWGTTWALRCENSGLQGVKAKSENKNHEVFENDATHAYPRDGGLAPANKRGESASSKGIRPIPRRGRESKGETVKRQDTPQSVLRGVTARYRNLQTSHTQSRSQ